MFIRNWKEELFTIPNLLSLLRIALLPVYVSVYTHAVYAWQYFAAAMIMAVSCLTDAVDGMVARKYNMISTVGKILDPVADKITQFTLTVCLSMKYPVLKPVLYLFVIKEVFQLIAGFLLLKKGKILTGALMPGKVCTAVLFVSLIALVLIPDMDPMVVKTIALIDSVFLTVSFASYIRVYAFRSGLIQDLDKE